MGLKGIIPWLVIAVICIALFRVGVTIAGDAMKEVNKLKKKKGGKSGKAKDK